MWSNAPPRVPMNHSASDESRASSTSSYSIRFTIRIAAPASVTSADDDDAPLFGGMDDSIKKRKPRLTFAPYFHRANETAPLMYCSSAARAPPGWRQKTPRSVSRDLQSHHHRAR